MKQEAQILRIEKISPNDGMGLRTVVFFKGCPLRCKWCSTPESQKDTTQLYYKSEKCVSCGRCVEICKKNALSFDEQTKKVVIDRRKCDSCYQCVSRCLKNALGVFGKTMTVKEVIKVILRDEVFYFHSGGGVTLSGGDVLRQAEFAKELLIQCKESAIHTMAELDMFGSYKNVEMLLPYLDEFYVDIKLMDKEEHIKWTGVDNQTILENTKKASKNCKKNALHIRLPLIWNVNDSYENILATANYCKGLENCCELEFLPYHRLGQITYESLGREYELKDLSPMSFDEAYEKVKFLKELNLPFTIKVSGKKI